jgi:hypothetical protein
MKAVSYCALVASMAIVSTGAWSDPFVEPDANTLALELLREPPSYDRPTSDAFTVMEGVGQCSRTRLRGIEVVLGWEVARSVYFNPTVGMTYAIETSNLVVGSDHLPFRTAVLRPGARLRRRRRRRPRVTSGVDRPVGRPGRRQGTTA